MATAIYTAIFGGYDDLQKPNFKPEGCQFVCFTDTPVASEDWKVIQVPRIFSDPTRDARRYKILPHLFLSDFKTSVWVDGNMVVRGNVNELIEKYLKACNMAVYNHDKTKIDKRDCLYKEAEVLIEMAGRGKHKDDPKIIKSQIEKYKQAGYPVHNGLISSMVLLRRHNEDDVKETDEYWWKELSENSRRDQLSFNYAAWKNKLNFAYIDEDSRDNPYFYQVRHKK